MTDTEVITEMNRGIVLIDDAYDGTVDSMSCVTLMVDDDGIDLVDDVTVELGVTHPFVGDLIVKLVSPQGTIITLLNRPGESEPSDDGAGVYGDDSFINKDFPVTFVEGGRTDAEDMGATLGTTEVICAQDGLCEYDPNPDSAAPGNLSSLGGEDSSGSWRVCIGDAAELNEGFFTFVELTIDQVDQ